MTANNESTLSQEESLTQSPDRFSNEAWNLLLSSEALAKKWRHEILDVEHVIQALFVDKSFHEYINSLPVNKSELLDNLESFLSAEPISREERIFVGDDLEDLLENANHIRKSWGSKLIEISHILMAIGRDQRIGAELFAQIGLPSERLDAEIQKPKRPNPKSQQIIRNEVSKQINRKKDIPLKNNDEKLKQNAYDAGLKNEIQIENQPKALEVYGRDLTAAAREGQLDPVIGRDPEIKQLIKVLSRRGKNNPVLIGQPGVGKTAIAELLAQRIVAGEVPDSIKNLKLIALDVGALIAGAKFRGQFEERFREVLKEVADPETGVVLFIDELHSFVGSERSIADAGSLLKPILARGDLRCIGATTPDNYRRTVEKDAALNRRFQQVLVKEPNIDLSVEILRGLKEKYESHHGVVITDEAVKTANRLADRYISDRCLPDKAIDLIDEAAAQLKMEATSKPKLIEEAEICFKKLEKDLITAEEEKKDTFYLQEKLNESEQKFLDLQHQWEQEIVLKEDIKIATKEQSNLKEAISQAEQMGDLEEAGRLQYDQLPQVEIRKQDLEDRYIDLKKSSKNILLRDHVEPEDIADVVSRWTGIPVNRVLAGERQKLLNLENALEERVIGQITAVKAVSAAIRRARAGMKDPKRPVGSFLFLGPTGVGKTELAKALAASLFDEEDALIRLDMSEFMERNAVARLLGAPPGYVGYEEGGQLTEAVRSRPYAVLLLDEIEKAHPDVFNLLLQVIDDGRLTDSQGRTVDFRHTVIVMTSNLASRAILENAKSLTKAENDRELSDVKLSNEIDLQLTKHFRPEFLNRIDEIIKFNPLGTEELKKIVWLHLTDLRNLLKEQDLELRIEKQTVERLAEMGYEPEYGARPLRRVIRRQLENPLATKLLEEGFRKFKAIRVKPSNKESESLEFFGEN